MSRLRPFWFAIALILAGLAAQAFCANPLPPPYLPR